MKAKHFFITLAMAAMAFGLGACSDDKTEPKPEPEPPVEKSKEAKILTFEAKSGDIVLTGKILGENNDQIQLVGMYDELQAMKAATATVTISEKASISPDPQATYDFTAEAGVKFTVTAEDGTTNKVYTVKTVEANVNLKMEKVWEKTPGDLSLAESKIRDCGIAFSGDKIVTYDCQVFDLNGNKVGTLNTTGMVNNLLVSMTNDNNGVLLASVATYLDGEEFGDTDKIKGGYVWIWRNGWDKAPELLLSDDSGDITRFMSITGDVNGDAILTIITGGRAEQAPQTHHCYEIKGGNWANKTWNPFKVNLPGNDGSWSQMVSACSANLNGYFFIFDSRDPQTPEDKEAGILKGDMIMSRLGINGTDIYLKGTLFDDGTETVDRYAGEYQYGNYSLGHVRGFRINGVDYGIASTSGFSGSYFTIQPAESSKDYLLRSLKIPSSMAMVCSAYLFNKEENCGEVILMATNYKLLRYKIVVELI